jgi:hypothetical protein
VIPSRQQPTIIVHHIGAPLGAAGEALLDSRWSTRIGTPIRIRDDALQHADTSVRLGRERDWLAAAARVLAWVAASDRAVACIKAPMDTTRRRTSAHASTLDSLRRLPAGILSRITMTDSAGWSIRAAVDTCAG